MNMNCFTTHPNNCLLFPKDENGREIKIFEFNEITITGESLLYPNPVFYDTKQGKVYTPYKEGVMSLKGVEDNKEIRIDADYDNIENDPVFFFIYNTDNYYHFVYDSLPILISFLTLKKTIPHIKLLMNYPNSSKNEFYRFVTEFLELIGVKDDIKLVSYKTLYKQVFVSNSYTHDIDSNLPPRQIIYDFYKMIVNTVKEKRKNEFKIYPENIYVSRRTWMHNDQSNIGTNYTTRRKMMNENELVYKLVNNGYTEVFTELLSTEEKILLFANANNVIGAIGGGLCNVLFSHKNCKLISLNSPTFLDINRRFTYSFNNVNYIPFNYTYHTEKGHFKTNMRVKVGNTVGEIIKIDHSKSDLVDSLAHISYSDTKIAGWNDTVKYNTRTVELKHCTRLDNGLNSPWAVNIPELEKLL